jgi:protein-S-isoprenylcysteine O-methyltransferase Ste14
MVHAAFQLAKRGVRSPSATQPLAAGWRCVSQRPRKQGLLVATMLGLLLLSATGSAWREIAPAVYASLRGSGLVLILLCILGRTWCTLYMGGRKNRELITRGPYSTMRNPLYLFSIVGTVGIGLLAGSVMAALLLGSIALAVFSYTVRREEASLEDAFGEAFRAYAARVPRFWPLLSAWQDADEVVVKPRLIVRTFADASLFLVTLPLIGLRDLLQRQGSLTILLEVP